MSCVAVDPLLGGGGAFPVEAPGGLPEGFEDVHEVDEDRHRHVAGGGFLADPVDLVVVAIDQGNPGSVPVGVAPVGFVEHPGDDLGGVVGDARGQPLVLGVALLEGLILGG